MINELQQLVIFINHPIKHVKEQNHNTKTYGNSKTEEKNTTVVE